MTNINTVVTSNTKQKELNILNNGESLKSYLHIKDAVEAIDILFPKTNNRFDNPRLEFSKSTSID